MLNELSKLARYAAICVLWPCLVLLLILSWITGLADALVIFTAEGASRLAYRLLDGRAEP